MAAGDKHAWVLPRGEGRLVLRELGSDELDDLAIAAARRSVEDPVAAGMEQRKIAVLRSLLEYGGRRVSTEYTSEELYHALSRRARKFVMVAWRSIHEAGDALVYRVLESCEEVERGRFRWYLDPAGLDLLERTIDDLDERARGEADDDEAAALQVKLDAAIEDLAAARAACSLVLREVLVGEVDRLGEDARRRCKSDPFRQLSEETRDALAVSFVRFRGADVVDGLATYRRLGAIDRDLVQHCWHQINDVAEDEVAIFLGSREATS